MPCWMPKCAISSKVRLPSRNARAANWAWSNAMKYFSRYSTCHPHSHRPNRHRPRRQRLRRQRQGSPHQHLAPQPIPDS